MSENIQNTEQGALEMLKAKIEKLAVSSPEAKALLAELETPSRPSGWSTQGVAPYYKPEYALRAKQALDKLLANPDEDVVIYSDPLKISSNTLYQQMLQGMLFLKDHMDEKSEQYPEGKYAKVISYISRHKRRKKVIIAFKDFAPYLRDLPDEPEEETTVVEFQPSTWRTELEDFIMNAEEGAEFYKTGQHFKEADVEYVQRLLTPLDNFAVISMTTTVLKIKRVPSI